MLIVFLMTHSQLGLHRSSVGESGGELTQRWWVQIIPGLKKFFGTLGPIFLESPGNFVDPETYFMNARFTLKIQNFVSI